MTGTLVLDQELRRLLARWLDEALRTRGWDQTELAKRSKVSRDTISRIANEKSGVRAETVDRLAGALDVTPPALTPVQLPEAASALTMGGPAEWPGIGHMEG